MTVRNRPVYRLPRARYERQVREVRQDLWGWVAHYRTVAAEENVHRYKPRQTQEAARRAMVLEYLAELAERLEEGLTALSA